MKKISMLTLALFGVLYISNVNANISASYTISQNESYDSARKKCLNMIQKMWKKCRNS